MRRLICCGISLLFVGLLLNGANADESGLVGWWKLDEGAGDIVTDSSGAEHDGAFTEGTLQWAAGLYGQALRFDGRAKVEIPDHSDFHLTEALTVALWANPEDGQLEDAKFFIKQKSGKYPYALQYDGASQRIFATVNASKGVETRPLVDNFAGQWAHLCFTYDGSALILYKDAEEVARVSVSGSLQQNELSLSIGGRLNQSTSNNFKGLLDDVRIYNRVLNAQEIQEIMQGPPAGAALQPGPTSGQQDVPRDVTLSWTPGQFADTHNLYFGTDIEQLNNADIDSPLLIGPGLAAADFMPGRLEFDTTYYWRVDEISADNTVFKGDVWSFTTEPVGYPVSSDQLAVSSWSVDDSDADRTADGSGLNSEGRHSIDAADMWLSAQADPNQAWIRYEFTQPVKLYQLWVWNYNGPGLNTIYGIKDAIIEHSLDGENWTTLAGVPEFGKAPGTVTYTSNTLVDFQGIVAKQVRITASSNWSNGLFNQYGLSEARFLAIPTQARELSPSDESAEVDPSVVLTWRASREAELHEVYLGQDSDSLTLADTVTGSPYAGYETAGQDLQLEQTYYWRVDEVNTVETPSVWEGEVLSFSTGEFLVVDDFESYTNDSDSYRSVFQTWIDGAGYTNPVEVPGNGTGSYIGYDPGLGDIMEKEIVYGGVQSAPVYYGQDGKSIAEVTRTFDTPQDWTRAGIRTLSLMFHGVSDNTAGQLYVKINNARVNYNFASSNITEAVWQAWNIDLTGMAQNVESVAKLTIGVEGGTGIVFVDEIRLYARAGELITPEAPTGVDLLAYYPLEGNVQDASGNGLNGAIVGPAQFVDTARIGTKAIQLRQQGYVNLGNPGSLDLGTGDWTLAAWFQTGMSGTSDSNKGTIAAKGGDNSGGHRYALIVNESTDGVVSLICDDNATKIETQSISRTNDQEWHLVVGQRQGSELRIYIDGQLEGTRSTLGAANQPYDLAGTSQHNAYIGAVTDHASGMPYKILEGLVDDVRLYKRALSQAEISWLTGRTAPYHKPF